MIVQGVLTYCAAGVLVALLLWARWERRGWLRQLSLEGLLFVAVLAIWLWPLPLWDEWRYSRRNIK